MKLLRGDNYYLLTCYFSISTLPSTQVAKLVLRNERKLIYQIFKTRTLKMSLCQPGEYVIILSLNFSRPVQFTKVNLLEP